MFELTISTVKQKSKDINYIISKIRPVIKQMKGVLVSEEYEGRVRIALAVYEDKKDIILGYVFDAIADVVILSYKEEYLKNNIRLKLSSELAKASFVRTLVMFDKANEKEVVKKFLKPCDEIIIDSLYLFRLWELEKKWKDLCDLVVDNAPYLQMDNTLTEMMRFIIMSNDVEFGELHLHKGENTIYAHGKDGREVFNVLYKEKDDCSKINVINELLMLSPEKIIVHNDVVDRDLSSYIVSLFDNKVCILN